METFSKERRELLPTTKDVLPHAKTISNSVLAVWKNCSRMLAIRLAFWNVRKRQLFVDVDWRVRMLQSRRMTVELQLRITGVRTEERTETVALPAASTVPIQASSTGRIQLNCNGCNFQTSTSSASQKR